MFLCYIDESGTHQISGNTSHYILAGLAIPADQWKKCDTEICKIKRQWELEDSEIHTAWILRPYLEQRKIVNFNKLNYKERRLEVEMFRNKELLRLQRSNPKAYKQIKKNYRLTKPYIHLTHDERQKIIFDITKKISKWNDARLFAECIDKIFFTRYVTDRSVEEQAFEQVVSRFEQFMRIISQEEKITGMVIHDNNKTIANRLTSMMKDFHNKGTLWTRIKHIIETPLFVDSHLTSMVQIADVCSYSLRRYVENNEYRYFKNIYDRADRKDGKVVGVRHYTDSDCSCMICTSH